MSTVHWVTKQLMSSWDDHHTIITFTVVVFFCKRKKHSLFLNVFHCDIFLVWLSVKVIFDFNQRIRWLRQAGGNLTSIKLLVRSLWQKTKIVFQVFDVVLAADEALFKHGNIQVPKWHGKVLWKSIMIWKSIMKQYCDLEKYCTGGMDDWHACSRWLWKGYYTIIVERQMLPISLT